MTIPANSVQEYLENVPEERKEVFRKIFDAIHQNIPKGFEERLNYGMISWVVPHSLYPAGYHCTPELPLPFMSIASQKNFIALYHMGIYANQNLLQWFQDEYPKHAKTKLNMGKSCIRFKKMEDIPLDLIRELVTKMTPKEWIALYEKRFVKK